MSFIRVVIKQSSLGLSLVLLCVFGVVHPAYGIPEGITVSMQAAKTEIRAVDPIDLRVTYTNNTGLPIKFLRWGTALDTKVPTDRSVISANYLRVNHNGAEQPYQGPYITRLPPTKTDYLILSAGESRSAAIDPTTAYDISRKGTYVIEYLGSTQSLVPIARITLNLIEDRARFRLQPVFAACSSANQTAAISGLALAESYARRARDDMRNTPITARCEAQRYNKWFGEYTEARWNKVQDGFNRIYSAASGQTITFNCACSLGSQNTIAYVFPNTLYEIHLCPGFFTYPNAGRDSKAGVVIHELSHFNNLANTNDEAYSFQAAGHLARNNPDAATRNASSFQYFAENSPGLTMPTSGSSCSGSSSGGGTGGGGTGGGGTGGGGTGGSGTGGSGTNPPPPPEPEPPVIAPIIDLLIREEND